MSRVHIIKKTLFLLYVFWTFNPFSCQNFAQRYLIVSRRALWKNYFGVFAMVTVTVNVKNIVEWLPWWYLLTIDFFFVARLNGVMHMQKDCFAINSLVSVRVTVRVHIYSQNMIVSAVSSELLSLLQPDIVWWYIIIYSQACEKIGLMCSWSKSQWWLRSSLNQSCYIFHTTEIFAAKLGVWT